MSNITTSGALVEQFSLGDIVLSTEPINNNGDGATEPFDSLPSSGLLPVKINTPERALQTLFDDTYKNIRLDKEDALRVAKSIHSLRRGGSSGVRLICAGDNCEFREGCELWKTKLGPVITVKDPQTGHTTSEQPTAAPVGEGCPLEEVVVQDARTRYRDEFQDLVNQDTENKVAEGYINDLCQIEMLTWRCNMVMSFDYANPIIQSPGAVTSDGKVIWTPAANPIMEQLERLQQRKTRILNDLVKTPREKYKKEHAVGLQGDDSLGRHQSAAKAALKKLTGNTLPDEVEMPEHVKESIK